MEKLKFHVAAFYRRGSISRFIYIVGVMSSGILDAPNIHDLYGLYEVARDRRYLNKLIMSGHLLLEMSLFSTSGDSCLPMAQWFDYSAGPPVYLKGFL